MEKKLRYVNTNMYSKILQQKNMTKNYENNIIVIEVKSIVWLRPIKFESKRLDVLKDKTNNTRIQINS